MQKFKILMPMFNDHWPIFFPFFRERETHSAHLKSIEAELDVQMAKVEQQALQKAKQEHENEKRGLQQKMNAELAELQTQLRLFQKVSLEMVLILNGDHAWFNWLNISGWHLVEQRKRWT